MKPRITNLFLIGARDWAHLVTGPGMSPRTVNLRRIFIAEIGWRNPFRVCPLVGSVPRVARSSQPWALMHNPFGIEGRSKVQRRRAHSDTQQCVVALSKCAHEIEKEYYHENH